MSQRELLNEIYSAVQEIQTKKKLNHSNPLYTVDKTEVVEWFEKIKIFNTSIPNGELQDKLSTFICENEVKIHSQEENFSENLFQKITQEFRENFLI